MRRVAIGGELRMKRAGLWAARTTSIVCLLLLTWMAFIQVTHVHPVASDTGHCPICVAMHSALPVALHVTPEPMAQLQRLDSADVDAGRVFQWSLEMASRPPPVGLNRA